MQSKDCSCGSEADSRPGLRKPECHAENFNSDAPNKHVSIVRDGKTSAIDDQNEELKADKDGGQEHGGKGIGLMLQQNEAKPLRIESLETEACKPIPGVDEDVRDIEPSNNQEIQKAAKHSRFFQPQAQGQKEDVSESVSEDARAADQTRVTRSENVRKTLTLTKAKSQSMFLNLVIRHVVQT